MTEPDGTTYPWAEDIQGRWHRRPADDEWTISLSGPNARSICGQAFPSVRVSAWPRDPGEDNCCPDCLVAQSPPPSALSAVSGGSTETADREPHSTAHSQDSEGRGSDSREPESGRGSETAQTPGRVANHGSAPPFASTDPALKQADQ